MTTTIPGKNMRGQIQYLRAYAKRDEAQEALAAEGRRAMEALDRAKASGSPSAIEAAKAELVTVMHKLESARVDILRTAAMSAALGRPTRLGE